ncbi:B-cell receptor CD22 isoform X2 [Carassius gibelio]|uniref:B-cell receptor CD22 isoform X2 n=1 Tax=Carassius gibelio TaxID=101364 RepID=UPI002279C0C1|nr:B-cell receptor CD22 isoform X2 [Carassius gibelio]
MGSGALPLILLLMSFIHAGLTQERPKAVLKVTPDERVFRGETVTLTCDIQGAGHIQWIYSWFRNGYTFYPHTTTTAEISFKAFYSGEYSCRGHTYSQRSDISAAVTLTVSDLKPKPELTSDPEGAALTGNTVTLICHVNPATGWDFYWYKHTLNSETKTQTNSYRVKIDSVSAGGQYWCRAGRGKPVYYTQYTDALWVNVTGQGSQVSLVVRPSRSQHFSSDSLSLSCEDQRNSAGWTVRRYTDRNTGDCSKRTGSTCRLVSLSTSDSGVYWCQSESGEKRHPLNITVHDGDVILESSVDPVIEGDTLTLHCLHRSTNSSILRADFYKDGSLVQSQTTGEMSITNVSESDEGFYYCKTERGESLHSWISVRGSGQISVFSILSFLLAAFPYLLSTVVLLFKCYRARGNTSLHGLKNKASLL